MKWAFAAMGGALLVAACAKPPGQETLPQEAAAAADRTLLGCWRTQHRRESFPEGRSRDVNGDCVFEYDATRVYSRCRNVDGDFGRTYAWHRIGPDRLRVTALDPATGKPTTNTNELSYRMEGDWLISDQQFDTAASAAAEAPLRATTLWIRSDARHDGAAACKPRGDSGLRVGRLPTSSLALTLPAGWEPWLVDPLNNKSLRLAVDRNFYLGAFVPSRTNKSIGPPTRYVLVLDDFRYGPSPVRATEFVRVKQRFTSELGDARLVCDLPDRVCAILRLPESMVYTELFNVRGRVAVVHAATSASSPAVIDELRSAAGTFIEQLRRDNP